MVFCLRIALLAALLALPGAAQAVDMKTAFNRLTPIQREYVQIRLRLPGFYRAPAHGRFDTRTESAIRDAIATPAFPLYRASARSRGIKDENLIAVYYVMSDLYRNSVVPR